MITGRSASDVEDLRAAAAVLSRAWIDDPGGADSHPGDLEWWYASAAPDELGDHLRIWNAGDLPVGWSWLRADQIHWEIWSGTPVDDPPVLEAILQAALDEVPGALQAWAGEDDAATISTLQHFGFQASERRLSQFQQRIGDRRLPVPQPPTGYRIRAVEGPAEIPARVDAHRAAFAPSRMTVEKYARLTTLPHYRFEDDLVVEASDGAIAAFTMAWWDPVARVGEFEPVGTHPDYQRRGLGRALLSHALHRYRELGAGIVQVYSNTDNAASEGLYQAVGFQRKRYRRLFERSGAAGGGAA